MQFSVKKFFLVLIIAIAATAAILVCQIIKAKNISVNKADQPLISDEAADIPIDPLDPIIGNRGASITITEFIDFTSEASRKAHKSLAAAVEKNPAKLRLLIKDFPASGIFASDHSRPHLGAYCALKQSTEKYDYYITEIIAAEDNSFSDSDLLTIAKKVGLNETAWTACLSSSEAATRIDSEKSLAKTLGLNKAPQIYINNRKVNYLEDIDLDDLLAELVKEY